MIKKFVRILKPKGYRVILIGQKELFEEVMYKNPELNILNKYNILTSGKKSAIYKLSTK